MPGIPEELLIAGPALVSDLLRAHGHVRIRALGGSMFPVIRSGDVLSIRRCAADAVQPGDVVLLRADERLFAHRLIEKRDERDLPSLVTRGDAHWRNDPLRPASALLGQVVSVIRNGRPPVATLRLTPARRLAGLAATEATRVARRVRGVIRRIARRAQATNGEW